MLECINFSGHSGKKINNIQQVQYIISSSNKQKEYCMCEKLISVFSHHIISY